MNIRTTPPSTPCSHSRRRVLPAGASLEARDGRFPDIARLTTGGDNGWAYGTGLSVGSLGCLSGCGSLPATYVVKPGRTRSPTRIGADPIVGWSRLCGCHYPFGLGMIASLALPDFLLADGSNRKQNRGACHRDGCLMVQSDHENQALAYCFGNSDQRGLSFPGIPKN